MTFCIYCTCTYNNLLKTQMISTFTRVILQGALYNYVIKICSDQINCTQKSVVILVVTGEVMWYVLVVVGCREPPTSPLPS